MAVINKRKAGSIIASRIDIQIEISNVPIGDLSKLEPGEPSAKIRERVIRARQIQTERFSSIPLALRPRL